MKILAIIICKLTRLCLRIIGRGGTALPGKIALFICPNLLGHLSRDVSAIVITGTNGKTTCSRIVEQAFINTGRSYFSNKSGANLITGITAEFALNANIFGKPHHKYAVIECDEAASKAVLQYLKPEVILVTNVFRDQLDRYGEVTHTLQNILTGLSHTETSTICLNADCSLTSSIAAQIPNKTVFYGIDLPIYKHRAHEVSDAPYCINCKHEYEYEFITYGHLGKYSCPNCGYSRPKTAYSVSNILAQTADYSDITIKTVEGDIDSRINIAGGFNIYNALSAFSALCEFGFSPDEARSALSGFECGFGRMEKFEIDDSSLRMILVKNPAGCNQVLNFLTNLDGKAIFVVCLNDNYADGTDISWIWDVNFEALLNMGESLEAVYVSGLRADDMALRLYYAGIAEEKLSVFSSYDELIDKMVNARVPVFIMPTYTAMLSLRQKISTRFGFKNFWE